MLKQINPALLELELGILLVGLVFQTAGLCLVQEKLFFTGALWIGILLALITVFHMYQTLAKALEAGKNAGKLLMISNVIRYLCIILVFVILAVTDLFNPLFTFLGLLSLKVAAYLQPVTHKLCNRILGR